MKRWSCLILVVSYLGALMGALSPLVYYIGNKEYIAQNLCENKEKIELECNGKCYLNKELSKSKAQSEQHTENIIEKVKSPELIGEELLLFTINYLTYMLEYGEVIEGYTSEFIYDIFRPPNQ